MKRRTISARFLGILAFLLLLTAHVSAVELVFVTPEGSTATELANCPVAKSGEAAAYSFSIVEPGKDPRTELFRGRLAQSPGVKKSLELLDIAARTAAPPVQDWLVSDPVLPVWLVPPKAQRRGPALYSALPFQLSGAGGKMKTSRLLVIADIELPGKVMVSPEEMLESGMLVPMVCHEVFHAIHFELTRERYLLFDLLAQMAGAPHDSPIETDPQIAFREGFAEAGEVLLGNLFPREFYAPEKSDGLKPAVADFLKKTRKRRILLAERNRYIFSSDGRVKDGKLKQGKTDFATEGVIASLIFTLWGHAGLPNPERAIFSTMADRAPTSFFELVSALIRKFPSQAGTIRRILLEYTCYTISSPDAMKKYEEYYLSKKAFVTGKITRDEFGKARQAWQDWKAIQYSRIASGATLCEAIPQPLIVTSRERLSLDLNDEQEDRLAWHLEAFIPGTDDDKRRLAGDYAARIVKRRKEIGTFETPDQLEGTVPAWLYKKLAAGTRRYQTQLEKSLDAALSTRRKISAD